MFRKIWRVRAALPLLMLGACRSIVGIEDAERDPKLSLGGQSAGGQSASGSALGGAKSGGSGGQGASAGQAGALSLCDEYCDVVMRNCAGALKVYESRIVCIDICEKLPTGVRGAKTGNSAACRLFHAAQVEIIGEAETECPAAGPGGAGICGENCEGYCGLLQGICPAEFDAGCAAECAALTDLGTYNSSLDSGASVQCRLYHVSAATQDSAVHCPHAGGRPPCAP